MNIRDIPISKIRVGKNIRAEPYEEIGELMESMERYDLLQPVIVVERNSDYELVAGFRRVKAAQLRNESTIAANVLKNLSDSDIAWVRLTENVVRKELSTQELMDAVDAMIKAKPELSYAGIAKILGKGASWLYNKRKAHEGAKTLMEKGYKEETVAALNDKEIVSLAKQKQPKVKRYNRKEDNEYQGFIAREAYQLLFDGPKKVIVICRDAEIRRRVLRCLWLNVGKLEHGLARAESRT